MKYIIILGDGMADWNVDVLGNKTLLQYAKTPYMDLLARKGRCGCLKTVPEGYHPGSEVANMSVLGYNLNEVYEGRGVLEAASIGVDLQPEDMALRCNLVCIDGDLLKNHSAGHITTEEAKILIDFLQEHLGNEQVHFYPGVQYRNLLVIKGGNKHVKCIPPHDVPLQPFMSLLVKPEVSEAEKTADLLNSLTLESQKLLASHPLNLCRIKEGKDAANSIWAWSPGYRPKMKPLALRFPQIRKGAVISAVDLIRGIGGYAGLRNIKVEGATGLYNTNYEGKVVAAIDALKTDDFVYLHIEASDEAGHEGNVQLKIQTIENLDKRVVGPIYEEVKTWNEPVTIAVLPDHPTPCKLRTHTSDPVPFLIYYPGIIPDSVERYDEESCKQGAYGFLQGDEFIQTFLKSNL